MTQNLKKPEYYFNRELSWIKFNERVLNEAMDESHPLLERLKFIGIFSSNLDEFFMIRVAGLKEQIHAGVQDIPIDGLTPEEQVRRISEMLHPLVQKQGEILEEQLLPALRKKGIRLRKMQSLRKNQRTEMTQYFKEKIFPVLTPLAVDPTHPFPQIKGLGLNFLVELRQPKKRERKIAVLQIPPNLERFIPLPNDNGMTDFIMLEDLIQKHIGLLFPNMRILRVCGFRIARNADLDLSEAEADDLLKLIERELRKRRLGTVIRLEIRQEVGDDIREFLLKATGLTDSDVYDIPTYLDLTAFMRLLGLDCPELKDPSFSPAFNPRFLKHKNVFETIKNGSVLLYHPYDSFNHVIEFVEEAANDPQVLAIKQTLYRTSGDSSIVKALKTAVENGKQVTALIELKARFDEKNNIEWAKELDRYGVNVVYGVLGLKTHCKICMVVRQENDRMKRYLHLSTGNYNEKTAKLYTDLGYMSADSMMGEDASELFNLLTGYSLQDEWNTFLIAPGTLRKRCTEYIRECAANHSAEQASHIIMVMNSLVDPSMIEELYKASMAGVKVDLVVRGICCLKPGLPKVSENIRVKSIVGRFLEHTRIFYFKSKGQSRIYLGSADLMQRNLNRRVELVFPIESPENKQEVRRIIQYKLDDNMKSHELNANGQYVKIVPKKGEKPFCVQEFFLKEAIEKQKRLDTIGA